MTGDAVSGVGVGVVGSINVDTTLHVATLPVAGETTFAIRIERTLGGKGLNQALAAARLVQSALIGAVGEDGDGDWIFDRIRRLPGLDVSWLTRSPTTTGSATIVVDAVGENSIVVLGGANATLRSDYVERALTALNPVVVLAQLEVPLAVVFAVRDWAERTGRRFVLNMSPMYDDAAPLVAEADPLIVNLGEARRLTGKSGSTSRDLALAIGDKARSAILTAGEEGSYVSVSGRVTHVPAHRVAVVDTTGAGDAFAGTLAAALAGGSGLEEAALLATQAAALVVSTDRTSRDLSC